MKTLSGVFTLVVASLAQTSIQPALGTGIPLPEADRVKLEAGRAHLRASTAELTAKVTVPADDRLPGRIAQADFFNGQRCLQDR